jgi:hypothetical protein
MNNKQPSLQVSANGRGLEFPDGKPFLYLADTAWELFHRLSRDEAERYLHNRAAKGFSVIQSVVLAELGGLTVPSPAGHLPLIDRDPLRPNELYFEDVDWVVDKAAELGLFIGMLPTWGHLWNQKHGVETTIFTPENAYHYGLFLGRRYKNKPIIWILGGDRMIETDSHRQIIEAMAQGVRDGDEGRHLITFHPNGQYSSALWFHEEPWLDFNMIQTGHTRDRDNYNSIAVEYSRTPIKPVVDGEPGYENIPHAFDIAHGRIDAYQTRKFCYWALFSGACGHTYGCNEIWQMWKAGEKSLFGANTPWDRAMDFPGAADMCHVRDLIESGAYFDRLPDQSLVASPNPTGDAHLRACRGVDGRYALIYFPTNDEATIRTYLLQAQKLTVVWFDPRSGERHSDDDLLVSNPTHTFRPPGNGDWVLILSREEDRH